MGYFLEIVAALVASYLLTPAVAFTWLRQTAAPRPAALQQRSTAVARSQGGFQAILRAASATTCPDCDLCADPFCGCAMCAASGTVLKKHSLPCGCESVCVCPGGFAAILRAASTSTCPDCDLCADPFCGCAMCAASGTVLKKHSLPCGCESVCLCPGGFANQAHAPGCQCDQCSH